MSGCCADKACNGETCMSLPGGVTCGSCVHLKRCAALFGCEPTNDQCDWFPRRYKACAECGGSQVTSFADLRPVACPFCCQ
jgi:hypothetical protein